MWAVYCCCLKWAQNRPGAHPSARAFPCPRTEVNGFPDAVAHGRWPGLMAGSLCQGLSLSRALEATKGLAPVTVGIVHAAWKIDLLACRKQAGQQRPALRKHPIRCMESRRAAPRFHLHPTCGCVPQPDRPISSRIRPGRSALRMRLSPTRIASAPAARTRSTSCRV